MKNIFSKFKLQKGFTLIELLIVIAVLGVLAAVVLVAIDPLDQLARARDAGRKSQVGQLSDAMQSYIVGQSLSTAPAVSTGWQDTLKSAGEIKVALPLITNAACTVAADAQNGVCYAPGAGTDYFVWTNVESKPEKFKAGNGAACPAASPTAIYFYDSSRGKSGNGCVAAAAAPTTTTTMYQ